MSFDQGRLRSMKSTSPSRSRMNQGNNTRQPLPKTIRDELRMCCALRGYSSIRSGDGKTLKQQHQLMSYFYHGVTSTSPSQILMLTQGISPYSDLFDTTTHRTVTSKSASSTKKSPTTKMFLKQKLSRDDSRVFYTGTDISFSDLEKKNRTSNTNPRTSNTLINGRQLTDMAKRGLRDYRKALSFTTDKWDLKKNEAIESGTTIDDVIEYVRRKMYLNDKVITIDDDDEEDKLDAIEHEEMKKLWKQVNEKPSAKMGTTSKESEVNSNDDDNNDNDINDALFYSSSKIDKADDQNDNEDDSCNIDKAKRKKERKIDDAASDTNTSSDIDDDEHYVPDSYFFNSFFAYCVWGPFATKEKQLTLLLLGKYTFEISLTNFIN